jgi:short-subunit dehydrogenase
MSGESQAGAAAADAAMAAAPAQGEGAVAILGATSPIARGMAIEFARQGRDLILAARDGEELERIAEDVRVRTDRSVSTLVFDALDFDRHEEAAATCLQAYPQGLAGVALCFGYMDEQDRAQRDMQCARRTIDVNYAGAVSLLERFAAHFEEQGAGFIAAVSSVAGDRGRQSNYIYGSAKAGLSAYLQGLRNRLHHAGATVTTIKPGFVDTSMTFGKEGVFLAADPQKAGAVMARAALRGASVVYVPWFWRGIMLIIKGLPERVFRRMRM